MCYANTTPCPIFNDGINKLATLVQLNYRWGLWCGSITTHCRVIWMQLFIMNRTFLFMCNNVRQGQFRHHQYRTQVHPITVIHYVQIKIRHTSGCAVSSVVYLKIQKAFDILLKKNNEDINIVQRLSIYTRIPGAHLPCIMRVIFWWAFALHWRHNGCDGVSHHQPYECLLPRLYRRKPKKTAKLRVTGLCAGNSPVTGEFPAQMASNAENVSIWWRHHGLWV